MSSSSTAIALVGFHGSSQALDSHRAQKHPIPLPGESINWSGEVPVIFFSTSKMVARTYGKKITRACVLLDNPLMIDAMGKRCGDAGAMPLSHLAQAFAGGHDGIVVNNISDVASGKEIFATTVLALDPDKILPLAEGPGAMSVKDLEVLDFDVMDKAVFGFNNDEVVSVDPKKLHVRYQIDLQCAEHDFRPDGPTRIEGVSLEEPIEVSIDDDCLLSIEDGHHRYLAALRRGVPVKAHIELKGNPIRVILARQQAWQRLRRPNQDQTPCTPI